MQTMILIWIGVFSGIYKTDPALVAAMVETESQFNPNATGSIGEIGLLQMRKEYLDSPERYYDPFLNLSEGVKRLSKLKRLRPRLGDNWFCAWNLGPTGALKMNNRGELHGFSYCKKIRERMVKYKGLFNIDTKEKRYVAL